MPHTDEVQRYEEHRNAARQARDKREQWAIVGMFLLGAAGILAILFHTHTGILPKRENGMGLIEFLILLLIVAVVMLVVLKGRPV
jgi:hypothetical protein